MILVAVANQKGGVGKTTTVVNLAGRLAQWGKQVLVVDLDPQGQCAVALGMDAEPGVFGLLLSGGNPRQWVRETGRERLHIIPGDARTGTAQIVFGAESRPISAVLDAIKSLRGDYDYILFDTPPSLGGLQERAIWAADLVIVPTSATTLSSDGAAQLYALLKKLWGMGWGGKLLGILPTFFDSTTESQTTLGDLTDYFGEALLSPIHRATALANAASRGRTIFEDAPGCRAAQEYDLVARLLTKYR